MRKTWFPRKGRDTTTLKEALELKKLRRLSGKLVVADPNAAWAIWQDDTEYFIDVTNGPTGRPLLKPVALRLSAVWTEADIDIVKYVIQSLSARQPSLIPFMLTQRSMFRLARHLRRSQTSSSGTLIVYADIMNRVFNWLHRTPDETATWLMKDDLTVNVTAWKEFKTQLEDYMGTLQARGLAPKTIRLRYSTLKTWLKVNDIPIPHVAIPKTRVIYHDRAPTPEELTKLLEMADLRGKLIVAMLCLGGFRQHTLAKLKYRHVKQDLERDTIPLHIHVESEITKGKYADYDTFIGHEAVKYLKLYMDYRRRGSHTGKIPPEIISDDSPLIRDEIRFRPILPRGIYTVVYDLYVKAGLITKGNKQNVKRHEFRTHSLRKYFRTQMTAAGAPNDYTEYMMGHVISTYNTIKTKGIDFLRNVYAASGLSIKPKTATTKLDILKEILRSFGYDPEKVLLKEAFSQPHRTVVSPINPEDDAVQTLRSVLRDLVRREVS